MKRTLAAALLLAALPVAAHAQMAGPIPMIAEGSTLLTVTANGEATREPDLAMFSAGVTTQGTSASQALAENSTRMTAVIAALKRAGIAERDIQTSNLNLNPVYAQPKRMPDGSYQDEERAIIGYQASNTVSVKQRKLGEYGKVIDALVTAGANQVNGPSFMVDDSEGALDEARTKAMAAAQKRANLYARAAGLRVARIVSISESGGYAPQPVMYRRAAMDAAPAAPPPTPIAAGELELSSSVTVQFELAR
ncbi:SIMPL domain-containing protein [Novosphingobium aquimarinum]|uniref:SIMPL domain-containing protein n=1 Tax=Novosphingobium aquimarinum TaxID=2682494 RepID=UPI0012EB39F2|nr:SIMPL domain-containing protein [Novosphingobium aquimarinum]